MQNRRDTFNEERNYFRESPSLLYYSLLELIVGIFFLQRKRKLLFSTVIVRRTHCWNGTFSKNSKGESRLRKKLVSNYDVTKKPCLVNHRFAIDSLPSKSISGERNIGGKNVDEELVAPSRNY